MMAKLFDLSLPLPRGLAPDYAISALMALYFNVFVLVVQLFRRVPALSAMAPTQSEPPFQIAQLAVLLLFAAIGILDRKAARWACPVFHQFEGSLQ